MSSSWHCSQNAALERTISALRAENNGKDLVVNTLRSELGMSNTAATAAADTNTAQVPAAATAPLGQCLLTTSLLLADRDGEAH